MRTRLYGWFVCVVLLSLLLGFFFSSPSLCILSVHRSLPLSLSLSVSICVWYGRSFFRASHDSESLALSLSLSLYPSPSPSPYVVVLGAAGVLCNVAVNQCRSMACLRSRVA